jgi:hypothetical protein
MIEPLQHAVHALETKIDLDRVQRGQARDHLAERG